MFDDNHIALTTATDNTSTAEANNNPIQQDPMSGLIDNADDKTFEGVTLDDVLLDTTKKPPEVISVRRGK